MSVTAAPPARNGGVAKAAFAMVNDNGDKRRVQVPWKQIGKSDLEEICRLLLDRDSDLPIRVVDLTDNQLGPDGSKKIATCLESTPINEVYFRFNDVGKEGCDAVAELLSGSPTLQVIDLRGNRLSANDVRKLLKSVANSTSLQQLGLGLNKVGPDGAALLYKALEKNTYLTALDLSSNEIGASGAQWIAKLLATAASTVQRLQLHGNYLGAEGIRSIMQALRTNKELRRLNIGGNNATDEVAADVAEMLATNYTLEELDLRSNSLTAAFIKEVAPGGLAKNASLRLLCLSANPVGSVGADELTKALNVHGRSGLEELDLSSCNLGSSGAIRMASYIRHSTALRDINLADNKVDDEAATILAESIGAAITVSAVDLSMNCVTEPGAARLMEAILSNSQLSSLILHGNNVNRVARKKIDNLMDERLARNRVLNQSVALSQQ